MNKLKSISRKTKENLLGFGLLIAVYAIVQSMVLSGNITSSLKGQLVPICVYIVMAVSLNLTVGVLGELSLGHAGFMSVGAFSGVVAAFSLKDAIAYEPVLLAVSIVIGGVFAAIAGVLIGVPVLRLKGDYLAIVTLAFGEIIKNIANVMYIGHDADGLHLSMLEQKFELAEGGKMVINGPMGVSGNARIATFTTGFVLIVITLLLILNLINSRAGRAIMAVRDNRIAAESIGVSVTRYKLLAFVISAAFAGMAGTLFAMNYSTVSASKFDFNTSILVLVFVVLGGLGNIWGSIVAAAALTVLPELLRAVNDYRMLIYAVVLIAMMLFNNSGFKTNMIERRAMRQLIKLEREGK